MNHSGQYCRLLLLSLVIFKYYKCYLIPMLSYHRFIIYSNVLLGAKARIISLNKFINNSM